MQLARGDRRGYVAVSYEGEPILIARAIGKKAKDVEKRLGSPDQLCDIEEAKALIARNVMPHIEEARRKVMRQRDATMAPLEAKRRELKKSHAVERDQLREGQAEREKKEVRERAARLRTGVRGLWDRLSGLRARTIETNEREALASLKRDAFQRDELRRLQHNERRNLQTGIVEVRQHYRKKLVALHQELSRLREVQRVIASEPRRSEVQREQTPARVERSRTQAQFSKVAAPKPLRSPTPQRSQQPVRRSFSQEAKPAEPRRTAKPERPEPVQQAEVSKPNAPTLSDRLARLREGRAPPQKDRGIERE